jgi:prepilin-type N-terminal cleavage/methylation domain-containing protein
MPTPKTRQVRRQHQQAGFTIIEVLVVVFVMGLIMWAVGPAIRDAFNALTRAENGRQALNNQNLASVLLDAARTQSTLGQLPAPYTGGSYHSSVADPGNTALINLFTQTGLLPNNINTDGTDAQNQRVYQLVSGLSMQVPLYFRSGPLVTLTYQIGTVYSTRCALADSSCNPGASGIPGASAALTSANAQTWTPTDPDYGGQVFSTLQLQRSMLQATVTNLDLMRDNFQNFFRENERMASATDTSNWYPAPTIGLAGQDPATNQGCYDGWYDLSNASVNVLAQIGMDQTRYGTTQWGGAVQYCRDYKPAATGANTIPHYGALRINANVSMGIAPDSSNPANNVVLTF